MGDTNNIVRLHSVPEPKPYPETPEWSGAFKGLLAFRIVDEPSFVEADSRLKMIREERKRRADYFETIKKPLNALRAVVLKMEHAALDSLAAAEAHLSGEWSRWVRSKRDEERLAKEAASKVVIASVVSPIEADPLAVHSARELMAAPSVVAAAEMAPTMRWSAKIDDLPELLRAIADGRVLLPTEATQKIHNALTPWLNDLAVQNRTSFNVPGAHAEETPVPSMRR